MQAFSGRKCGGTAVLLRQAQGHVWTEGRRQKCRLQDPRLAMSLAALSKPLWAVFVPLLTLFLQAGLSRWDWLGWERSWPAMLSPRPNPPPSPPWLDPLACWLCCAAGPCLWLSVSGDAHRCAQHNRQGFFGFPAQWRDWSAFLFLSSQRSSASKCPPVYWAVCGSHSLPGGIWVLWLGKCVACHWAPLLAQ